MNLSNSQINLFKTCRHAYYCKYFLNIQEPYNENFRFGTEFHNSIPKLRSKEKEIDVMVKALKKHKGFMELYNRKPDYEVKHYLKLDGLPFVVIYDGLLDDTILEFKSASKIWTPEKVCNEFQPHIYLKAEHERTGKWKRFVYIIVTKDKRPRIQFIELGFDKEKWKEARSIGEQIMKEWEYKCTCESEFFCNKFCSFKNNCPKFF